MKEGHPFLPVINGLAPFYNSSEELSASFTHALDLLSEPARSKLTLPTILVLEFNAYLVSLQVNQTKADVYFRFVRDEIEKKLSLQLVLLNNLLLHADRFEPHELESLFRNIQK